MLGFLIGTACLIGLIKVLRGGSCGRGSYGWGGGGCGGGGCGGRFRDHHDRGGYRDHGGYDDGPPWGRGWAGWGGSGGAGFFLRGLVEHLDASREQEKVISDAAREVRDEGAKWRDEVRRSRADLGKAMRAESFDEVVLGELFARHDAAIEAMRRSMTGALAKVHVVLDEAQRGRLAELLEHGPSFSRWSRRGRRHEEV